MEDGILEGDNFKHALNGHPVLVVREAFVDEVRLKFLGVILGEALLAVIALERSSFRLLHL